MSESQTGFRVYQFGMLKTEVDTERSGCDKRAEEAEKFFTLRLCVLYEVETEAEDKAKHWACNAT
jgi:hypothetical protein